MQYLVFPITAIATSFALEVSLSPALVLSFRIFSDEIPCLSIFSRSSFHACIRAHALFHASFKGRYQRLAMRRLDGRWFNVTAPLQGVNFSNPPCMGSAALRVPFCSLVNMFNIIAVS